MDYAGMLTAYISAALQRAKYEVVDAGVYGATVPGLRGVIATAESVEACRSELASVVEAWVLVRVARGLRVPPLGGRTVEVKRAS
jgi:predicted RNase H-like HicB family nuclease